MNLFFDDLCWKVPTIEKPIKNEDSSILKSDPKIFQMAYEYAVKICYHAYKTEHNNRANRGIHETLRAFRTHS